MAGTHAITLRVKTENGSYQNDFVPGSQTIIQTGIGSDAGVLNVTTGIETIKTDKLSVLGLMVVTNTDATQAINIGPSTTTGSAPHHFLKLKGTESYPLRLSTGITFRAHTTAGTAKLQYTVFED